MLGAGFVTLPTLHILSEAAIAVTVGMLICTSQDARTIQLTS